MKNKPLIKISIYFLILFFSGFSEDNFADSPEPDRFAAFIGNGSQLLVLRKDMLLRRDVATGKEVKINNPGRQFYYMKPFPRSNLVSIIFRKKGRARSWSYLSQIWDMGKLKPKKSFRGFAVPWQNGEYIYVGDHALGGNRLLSGRGFSLVYRFPKGTKPISGMEHEKNLVFVLDKNGKTHLIDVASKKTLYTLNERISHFGSDSVDGKRIQFFLDNKNQSSGVLDVLTGKVLYLSKTLRFSLSPDGNYVAFIREKNTLVLLNVNTGVLHRISPSALTGNKFETKNRIVPRFSPDGKYLLVLSADGIFSLLDVKTKAWVSKVTSNKTDLERPGAKLATFSQNSQYLAVASGTNSVSVFKLDPMKRVAKLSGNLTYRTKAVFSGDGRTVALLNMGFNGETYLVSIKQGHYRFVAINKKTTDIPIKPDEPENRQSPVVAKSDGHASVKRYKEQVSRIEKYVDDALGREEWIISGSSSKSPNAIRYLDFKDTGLCAFKIKSYFYKDYFDTEAWARWINKESQAGTFTINDVSGTWMGSHDVEIHFNKRLINAISITDYGEVKDNFSDAYSTITIREATYKNEPKPWTTQKLRTFKAMLDELFSTCRVLAKEGKKIGSASANYSFDDRAESSIAANTARYTTNLQSDAENRNRDREANWRKINSSARSAGHDLQEKQRAENSRFLQEQQKINDRLRKQQEQQRENSRQVHEVSRDSSHTGGTQSGHPEDQQGSKTCFIAGIDSFKKNIPAIGDHVVAPANTDKGATVVGHVVYECKQLLNKHPETWKEWFLVYKETFPITYGVRCDQTSFAEAVDEIKTSPHSSPLEGCEYRYTKP